jgi:hypothetical protein
LEQEEELNLTPNAILLYIDLKGNEMKISRGLQDQFCEFLRSMGFNGRGEADLPLSSNWVETSFGGHTNGEFVIRPYWWVECECEEECKCRASAPNFEHVPSNFSLSWYKYPLRDADSSDLLTARLISEWRLKFP